MVASVERIRDVPSGMGDFAPDYWDCFALPAAAPGRPARDWAAGSLRGADAAGGAFSRLVWHGGLGFRLAPRGEPGTLVGWVVTTDEDDEFVLETDGRWMAGRMRFTVSRCAGGDGADGDTVRWTTMLRFHGSTGRRIWSVAAPVHRTLAPRCLRYAAGSAATP